MKLFRAKTSFWGYCHNERFIGPENKHWIFEGQLFTVEDETFLPDPRKEYRGNLKPFYEEILPKSMLYRSVNSLIKTREL